MNLQRSLSLANRLKCDAKRSSWFVVLGSWLRTGLKVLGFWLRAVLKSVLGYLLECSVDAQNSILNHEPRTFLVSPHAFRVVEVTF